MTTQTLDPVTADLRERRVGRIASVVQLASGNALAVGVLILCAAFYSQSHLFLSAANIRSIATQSSITLIIAVPACLLLMSGEVDLSVGSTVALSAVVAGLGFTQWQLPIVLAIFLGLACGLMIGALNALLVVGFQFSSLIVTLGSLSLVRGLAEGIGPNPIYNFPAGFVKFGNGIWMGIPYLALVAGAVTLLGGFYLALSPTGKHVRALGVSKEAAFLSGIRVRRLTVLLFVATGVAAGLGGILTAARLGSAPSSTAGVNLELDVLTAVLLGGTTFGGGKGTIRGTVLGVVFLVALQSGLTIQNVAPAWSTAAKGVALMAAALLNFISVRRQTAYS
jgi:ribose transport system permease protein